MTVAAPIIAVPAQPARRTAWLAGAISVLMHLAVGLAVILSMLPAHPPSAPIPIELVLEPPAPPAPQPPAAPTPQIATQPPADPPPQATPATPFASPVPSSPPSAASAAKPPAPANQRASMAPFTVRPTDFQRVGQNWMPVYPELARANGLQGQVVVTADIDIQGRPVRVAVSRSSGHASLDEAARQAVRFWKFKPPRYNGQSVTATIDIPFDFRL